MTLIRFGYSGSHSTSEFLALAEELKRRAVADAGYTLVEGEDWLHKNLDFYIAIIDFPSTIIGGEISDVWHRGGVQVLVFAHADTKIHADYETGRYAKLPNRYHFTRYKNLVEDVLKRVTEFQMQ